ncbi:hypothetical protein [Noviherbaspirillum humi]|uniref:hypothetical protein n=1 Tax=Noviherbaspirillum humi TaxID=1688639 RepID=UPI00116096AA|nr:hypothetical protein [Noviherbaspirillum humi]
MDLRHRWHHAWVHVEFSSEKFFLIASVSAPFFFWLLQFFSTEDRHSLFDLFEGTYTVYFFQAVCLSLIFILPITENLKHRLSATALKIFDMALSALFVVWIGIAEACITFYFFKRAAV